jgi:hypothetical protein
MIAMSLTSTYEAYRRDRTPSAPVYPPPSARPRHALLRMLARIGLGAGGGAVDDDEPLGIG